MLVGRQREIRAVIFKFSTCQCPVPGHEISIHWMMNRRLLCGWRRCSQNFPFPNVLCIILDRHQIGSQGDPKVSWMFLQKKKWHISGRTSTLSKVYVELEMVSISKLIDCLASHIYSHLRGLWRDIKNRNVVVLIRGTKHRSGYGNKVPQTG